MKTKNITTLLAFVVCILTISLLTSGGCPISFSNSNGGGGGNTGSASVKGIITSITPNRDLGGITVRIDSADTFSGKTDSNGIFQIPQGNFSGLSLRLEFRDESQTPSPLLALTSVTVFSGATVDLGNITITNGNVTPQGDVTVDFKGDISENNCSGGTGTIVVTADNTDVIVQVLTSTDIVDSNTNPLPCANLTSGTVDVKGKLLVGNAVQASRIELQ